MNTQQSLLLLRPGQKSARQICVTVTLIHVTGGYLTAAYFLAQCVYWSDKGSADGWFYKTLQEWQDELGITAREIRYARNRCVELGFIKYELRGSLGFYFVNMDVVNAAIDKYAKENHLALMDGDKMLVGSDKMSGGGNNLSHHIYTTVDDIRRCTEEKSTPIAPLPVASLPEKEMLIEVQPDLEAQKKPKPPPDPERERQVEALYLAYPRKVAKPAAVKAITKALKLLPFETLLEKTEAYAKACVHKERQFIPHPSTWFNQARYNDDIEEQCAPEKPKANNPAWEIKVMQDQIREAEAKIEKIVADSEYRPKTEAEKSELANLRRNISVLNDRKSRLIDALNSRPEIHHPGIPVTPCQPHNSRSSTPTTVTQQLGL